jgi:hypothetical protein
MSKISLSGPATGTATFTITTPAGTSTDRTLTLPDNSGTVITTASTFAGTGPAFSAYSNAQQTITSGSFTQVTFQIEEFDTNSNFASNTFTPTVAGYYQITFNIKFQATTTVSRAIASIYKNGATTGRQWDSDLDSSAPYFVSGSKLVYCNGTTDAITIYVYMEGTGTLTTGATDANTNYFSGVLVRSA